MTTMIDAAAFTAFIGSLPAPFCEDRFVLRRTGVHDDAAIAVHVNEQGDFAVLFPQPQQSYERYTPRFKNLGLDAYRKRNQVVERRFAKLCEELDGAVNVLEIGALDGAFLRHSRAANPALGISSLEVDVNSRPSRDAIHGLAQYADFAEVVAAGRRFDRVALFHVLEHIVAPALFLAECRTVMARGAHVIIEVPSLDDPLLSLYAVPEYESFYFQRQHPYVYSARSLVRLLEANGFRVLRTIPHQRYGLENHLTWLGRRRPGGDEALARMFADVDDPYRIRLEAAGQADAVIVVAENAA